MNRHRELVGHLAHDLGVVIVDATGLAARDAEHADRDAAHFERSGQDVAGGQRAHGHGLAFRETAHTVRGHDTRLGRFLIEDQHGAQAQGTIERRRGSAARAMASADSAARMLRSMCCSVCSRARLVADLLLEVLAQIAGLPHIALHYRRQLADLVARFQAQHRLVHLAGLHAADGGGQGAHRLGRRTAGEHQHADRDDHHRAGGEGQEAGGAPQRAVGVGEEDHADQPAAQPRRVHRADDLQLTARVVHDAGAVAGQQGAGRRRELSARERLAPRTSRSCPRSPQRG